MQRRIFIAISLPEDIKKTLVAHQEKIETLFEPPSPIRWTKKDKLHITWEFLGYLSEDELIKACQDTQQLSSKHKPFTITLNKICYGPPKKMPYSQAELETGRPAESGNRPPRMIWATGEKNKELGLTPHITLGRIKTWEFRHIEPEERPSVDENINLTFPVNSIEVVESVLKREGPSYTVLESYLLELD